MPVRKINIYNEEGEKIDCLLREHFFNDLSGLGFSTEHNFLSAGDGFYYPTKKEAQQQTIAGKMSFLNRSDAYADYRSLTEWINSSSDLTIGYIPYGSDEYFVDVVVASMSKGELDVGGFLTCDIEFLTTSPYYSHEAIEMSFDGTLLDGQKEYDYSYDYIYGLGSVRGQLQFSLTGDYAGGLNFTAYGGFADPILSLFDAETYENLGYLDLTGQTFTSDQALIFYTTFKDSGVWKQENTERTSLINYVVVHQNRDVFFRIPTGRDLILRFSVAGVLTTPTEIKIFKYYKTR